MFKASSRLAVTAKFGLQSFANNVPVSQVMLAKSLGSFSIRSLSSSTIDDKKDEPTEKNNDIPAGEVGTSGSEQDATDARLKSILENIRTQLAKRSQRSGEGRMAIAFTCNYDGECSQPDEDSRRVVKLISKHSYEKGVVLVKCPCENLHLIADNLGWFGEERNIEEILQSRGEQVQHLQAEDLLDIDHHSVQGGSSSGGVLG